jgi:catechol 2,3-dioxygenase-like lactoylglutathione lyase family enzyme
VIVTGVRHVGIVVRDLERALAFYRDGLGLAVVKQADEQGAYLDNMLALPGVRVTTVKLRAPDGGPTLVELLRFREPPNEDGLPRALSAIGPSHVAFTVADLDLAFARLEAAGVRFHAPPQLSPDGYAKVTYCRDPDGTPVELVEVLR